MYIRHFLRLLCETKIKRYKSSKNGMAMHRHWLYFEHFQSLTIDAIDAIDIPPNIFLAQNQNYLCPISILHACMNLYWLS